MNKPCKIHYATVAHGTEARPADEWSETACGIEVEEKYLSQNKEHISCSNCLKVINKLNQPIEPKSVRIIINGITKQEHQALHGKLKKKFGKADRCEMPDCKSVNPKYFNWALRKGHAYSSNKEDYIKMCISCHRKYDFNEDIRVKLKGKKYCENNNNAKLSNTDVMKIIEYINNGLPNKDIAVLFAVKPTIISDIKTGKRWSKLTGITWKKTRR